MLTWLQDLDLGTIMLGPGTWSGATVGISQAGVFSCANANVTCTGATKVAQVQCHGTNKQVVRISAPNVTLVNQSDPTQDADAGGRQSRQRHPDQLRAARVNFSLGGSITLSSTTAGGTYSGRSTSPSIIEPAVRAVSRRFNGHG